MPLIPVQRQAILRAARTRLGTACDAYGDQTWKDLSVSPTRLDCATLICRVAKEALGYGSHRLAPDPKWLLDNLVEVTAPTPGDLVGYQRQTTVGEQARLDWHVMIYVGNGRVIGACDLAGAVVERSIDYDEQFGARRWQAASPSPFRALEIAS